MFRFLFLSFLYLIPYCNGMEESNLHYIKQLTFPSMGFEKAGEAYFSPDDQTIIFQAVPLGQEAYQIYSLDLKSGTPELVSTGKGACTCAFFHPNGEKIIFASSHEDPFLDLRKKIKTDKYTWEFTPYMNIYEANLDGSELKALTTGKHYHAECAYSPDGQEIVFASNESGSMNLHIMNADGTKVRQITHSDKCYNGGPFFSPDGKQVIFRADRNKKDYLQIYVVSADGKNEIQLTDNNAINWAPYWHPNGNVIAYTTSLYGHHAYSIQLLNLVTKNEVRLTDSGFFDGLPVFSHDGSKLLWTSKRGPDHTCQIFIADFNLPEEVQ
jgi:TolB protein